MISSNQNVQPKKPQYNSSAKKTTQAETFLRNNKKFGKNTSMSAYISPSTPKPKIFASGVKNNTSPKKSNRICPLMHQTCKSPPLMYCPEFKKLSIKDRRETCQLS